jgi:hypothetical protein
VCSKHFVTFILKGKLMNATATSEPTPAAEIPLTRAAKEELLRQMYSRAHWIELIRLIGYQTVPMDKARQAIKPLAEQYGKEPMASACEVLVEIFTQDKDAFARLKPHVRRMAFQILGPEPAPDAVTPTAVRTAPAPNQSQEAKQPRRAETKKAKKPAKAQARDENAVAPSTGGRDGLMQQYRAAKEKHPDMLLVFRMGDFYELFDQDAETAHKLLGLTLTTRDRTLTMAGFPHHQLEVYLHKLLHEGQRVAICEPVEDSLARGPIRREVTRVVTPGTTDENGKSNTEKERTAEEDAPIAEGHAVRQPRHFVLQRFEAWLNEAGLAFVAIEDVRRTTPAVAAYVGVLDFIVMRGDEKLLVTVRPRLQAKHLKAIRELQNLFGSEYKPMRMWPSEGPDGWNWHDYPVDISETDAT